jgi:hypothetical protein
MLLYHGSNVIVKNPQLIEQTRGLDFGSGFYLTTNKEQAIRFSNIVFKRKKTGVAGVSEYMFDITAAEKTLDIHKFDSANIDWLRFVAENRLKTYKGQIYDIVIGAVANDTVMPTIQLYLNGFINEDAALITLKAGNLVDQYCLKTEKALSMLNFCNAYEIKDRANCNG